MKNCFKPLLSFVVAAGLLSGCATSNAVVEIQGEVWYKERIALPPEAVISIKVQDVSLMDAPAVVIAEFERSDVSTPTPFQFMISLLSNNHTGQGVGNRFQEFLFFLILTMSFSQIHVYHSKSFAIK